MESLTEIVIRSANLFEVDIDPLAAVELAKRSRGTPRIANRLLRRVRDYAQVRGNGIITLSIAQEALDMLQVDHHGLDQIDHQLLHSMIERFRGGPVGIDTLAASIGEESVTIEDVYEPYLLQMGFIQRTSRGRMATEKAYEHFGYPLPE